MASVGPQLPPHLMKRKRSSSNNEDDDSSIPPTKIQAASPTPKERRVLGPSLPPAPLDERPHEPANATETDGGSDSSSDDSDSYGPLLPPPGGSGGAASYNHNGPERLTPSPPQAPKPQRSEWMLAPPNSDDWTSRIDPTKLKARKFASGKGAKAPAEKSGISAIWTETPEEKLKRLEDEVMGRTAPATSSSGATRERSKKGDKEAEETARRIRDYNEKMRGESLYEMKQKKKDKKNDEEGGGEKEEEEDDPSARAFDKEKDMRLGGRLGHVQKREMVKRASDFGSRFERGSYL